MKHLVWMTAIVLATLIAVALAWQLRVVILVFLFSLWTAAALRPAVEWLAARGLNRGLALGSTYLAGLSIVVALALVIAKPLASELQKLGDESVVSYEELAKRWEHGSGFQQAVIRRLPVPEKIFEEMASNQGWLALQSLLGFTFGLFDAAVHLVIVLVLSLYWSMDRVHFERLWLSLLSAERRAAARSLWRDIEAEVGGYLRSEVIQSVAGGMLLAGGYRLLDYPYPVLMAVIAAVCWLIPWLGVVLAVLIELLLALPMIETEGLQSTAVAALGGAVITLAVLLVLEIWIEPRFFRRRRYNSLLTVIVVVALADAFGVVGLILGPPVAAALQIVGGHLLRGQVIGHTSQLNPLALDEQLTAVRTALASLPDPPNELTNLVGRLEELVRDTEEITSKADASSAQVVFAGATTG